MPLQIKSRFLKTEKAKRLADLSASEEFQEMLTLALAQMQEDMPNCNDLAAASINQFRMEGAKKFINALLTLADQRVETKAPVSLPPTLNPNPTLPKKAT